MSHRLVCSVIITGFLFVHGAVASLAEESATPPNIILMMADDLGYGDVGFNGNTLVQTPNLDRMAADGIRFTRFYSIGPLCSPTRASFQTGRHYMRFGMKTVNIGKLPEGEINIAQIAKQSGYTTGHFGKWHLGTLTKIPELAGPGANQAAQRYAPPWERHYDVSFATETNVATWDPFDETDLRIPKHRCHFWSNGEEVKADLKGSSDGIITDRAIDFIKGAVAEQKPFMTTIWFYAPHTPVRASEELRSLYPNEPLGRQHYLGSITALDQQVGRIRTCLEELGVAHNTLIFFCADNGPEGDGNPTPTYDPYSGSDYGETGGLKGRKRDLYNGGVCVPAFAFWPGRIEAGRTVEQPACVMDYLPTMADLLGFTMPDERPIDGISLLPLFEDAEWTRSQYIPFASDLRSPEAAIIQGDYKLLIDLDKKTRVQLYHLHNDPSEQTDLSTQHPEIAQAMQQVWSAWRDSAEHSYSKGDYPGFEKQGGFLKTAKNRKSDLDE